MPQPKFEIGDRVTYASPELPYQKNRGIGEVVWETVSHYYIVWQDDPNMECPHLKDSYSPSELLINTKVLEKSKSSDFPELFVDPKTHGYIEWYEVHKKSGSYSYKRYTYQNSSGKLRHHHISDRQVQAIEAMWKSGATCQEICIALGKNFSH